MSISFDSKGNPSPPGYLRVKLAELLDNLCSIDDRNHRELLGSELKRYNSDMEKKIDPAAWEQWFGGSFTTNKTHPNDVDVVNFIDEASYGRDLSALKPFHTNSNNPLDSKSQYRVDSYIVPIYPEGDPRKLFITNDRISYWSKWFGHDRDKNPKAIPLVVHK